MRSLVYVGPRQVEWQEVPEPALDDDEAAIVRPVASAVCDLDRRIVRGATPLPAPFALGHEAVAEVVDAGDAAARAGIVPGRRVVVPYHVSCGTCAQCRADRPATCTTTPPQACFGIPLGGHFGGLFDDRVRVPFARHALVPVPDGLPSEVAASSSDQMTDAYAAIAPTLRDRPGAEVLVVGGLASMGLWAVMFAAALGAGRVVYADPDADAGRLAARLGATEVLAGELPDRVDGGFDLAVDTGGDAARSLPCALRSVRPGGTVAGRSMYFDAPAIPYWDIYRQGVVFVTGPPQVRPHVEQVLGLLESGRADPREALTAALRYEDAPDVLHDPPRKAVFVRSLATRVGG